MKDFFIHFLTPSLFFTLLFVSFVGAAEGDNQEPTEFEFEFKSTQSRGTIMGEDDTTNFFIEPRVVVGELHHSYKEIYKGEGSSDIKWEDNMPFAGLGITLGYKNFSLDVYAQQSASGKDSFFSSEVVENGVKIKDYNTDISREDYAINLSYARNLFVNWDDRIVFSVGYKAGKTSISGARRNITPLSDEEQYISLGHEEKQFETNGPTVGISYGFPIGESVIGLNLAYAWLETTYTPSENVTPDSTSGLTLGILLSSPITNNLMFNFSVDGYQYTMNAEPPDERESLVSIDTIEESVFSIKTSLSYAFDF